MDILKFDLHTFRRRGQQGAFCDAPGSGWIVFTPQTHYQAPPGATALLKWDKPKSLGADGALARHSNKHNSVLFQFVFSMYFIDIHSCTGQFCFRAVVLTTPDQLTIRHKPQFVHELGLTLAKVKEQR